MRPIAAEQQNDAMGHELPRRGKNGASALPPKAAAIATERRGRFGPCVDGSELARRIFTSQVWSVQPCVRPLDAVHMTAGHNALRGSGPGQKPSFKNALADVSSPDRRIGRLRIMWRFVFTASCPFWSWLCETSKLNSLGHLRRLAIGRHRSIAPMKEAAC